MKYVILGAILALFASYASAESQKTANEYNKTVASHTDKSTCYKIANGKYGYSYNWSQSSKVAGPSQADGSTRAEGKPWAFNWCCRRDPGFIISGDRPRVALCRRYIQPSLTPPIISFGDLRIRCTIGGKSYLLDDADNVSTMFYPWGTEHKVRVNSDVPVDVSMRTSLIENRGMAVLVTISSESKSAVDADIELIYGGMADKGNAQQVATYFIASPDDSSKNNLVLIPGGVSISSPGIASRVNVIADPADDIVISPVRSDAVIDNRAVFKYTVHLTDNPKTIRFLAYEVENDSQDKLTISDFERYHSETTEYYENLLAPFEMKTPDPILNAGFYSALLNFDYDYESPAWLEGVHCWSGHLINNYQMSAAVLLNQLDRAKKALLYFADNPEGPCPGRKSDGSLMVEGNFGFEEGIPYYIEQLYRYWIATGDDATLNTVWDSLVKNFEKYWTIRDPDSNSLLNYHESSNAFLYQADHLSLPGDASSPSIIMTDCLEKMADMADVRSDTKSAQKWRRRAEYMRTELIKRLWSTDNGKFVGCIDAQGFSMEANYYTDFVFPQLYSSLPTEYSWISLKTLDRTLWVGDSLMRVGDLKPSLFGNDNVMPVQMAEAAEAYFKAGRSDEGYRLLQGTAFSASTYTDSPGSFPERMSDTGFGLSDYVFGNPIGSFIRGAISGMFGIERVSKEGTAAWHPAIPDRWDSASLRIDDISVSVSGIHGNRTYKINLPAEQKLDFRIPLHNHNVVKVQDADGHDVPFNITPHPSGGFLQITGTGKSVYQFHIISSSGDMTWKMPAKVTSGGKIKVELPASELSVIDPQRIFANFQIDGNTLSGRFNNVHGIKTFFLESSFEKRVIPVELDFGALKSSRIKEPMMTGKKRQISLERFFNSDTIQSRNMWRISPVSFDMTKVVKGIDQLKVEGLNFRVKPSGRNICLVEVGDLHPYTNALRLSDNPEYVRIPVEKAVKGVELLMVAEWKVRLTRMHVGDISLHYTDGSEQIIPLINGWNTSSFNGRHSDGVTHYEMEWLKNMYVLSIKVDPTRYLEYIEIKVLVPDGSIGIFGMNTVVD